jgi:hypothetical protein
VQRFLYPFFLLLLSVAACDCSDPIEPGCSFDSDCEDGGTCLDGACVPRGVDVGPRDAGPQSDAVVADVFDAGPACTTDDMCGEGVCLEGSCCASLENVCGTSCCGAEQECFANACVTPGDECASAADCDDGEYCELGLGTMPPPDPTMACTSVPSGRCLMSPPSCDEPGAAEGCVRSDCQFMPDDTGELDAVVQWRWDPTTATEFSDRVDVWSTPVVGRIYDTNCDGRVDSLDPSAIIFVSNNTDGSACHQAGLDACRRGILRALDGATGRELWSLPNLEGSEGFSAVSAALGDLDDNGVMDIVLITAERRLAAIDGNGELLGLGEDILPVATEVGLGWGGGLAMADMDGDGNPEVAWRGAVYTWADGTFTEVFNVASARGGWDQGTVSTSTSFFVNLDSDEDLELLAGRTAIKADGTILWQRLDIADGFSAVADFNADGEPDIVHVASGTITLLRGDTGETLLGPYTLTGNGFGGPPTVADFDGDGEPEIGVAQQNRYSMVEVDFAGGALTTAWATLNHDNSSSVTGSTVFDFEGDGVAEVIYNDECFMWVFDGPTGDVRFSAPTASFTGTEASLVADVDGDGHAEMVMISTGADPTRWTCAEHTTGTDGYPIWEAPSYADSWKGITVFRDQTNSWVATRSLWTQHAYHVTNTCDGRDAACDAALGYGAIPLREERNWTLPWLNNFRQNVQNEGIFNAPDAQVSLRVECTAPLGLVATVRNQGPAPLPAGVEVGFFRREGGVDTLIGTGTTTGPTLPGRGNEVRLEAPADVPAGVSFVARIQTDADAPLFRECDLDNNESEEAIPRCLL